jgi:single-stranded-DNA-specific exonuclease
MRPVFIAKNIVNSGYSKILKDQHIKFEVRQNNIFMSGIGFNMAHKSEIVFSGKPFDIVFTIEENEYNGNTRLQLMVIDCRASL